MSSLPYQVPATVGTGYPVNEWIISSLDTLATYILEVVQAPLKVRHSTSTFIKRNARRLQKSKGDRTCSAVASLNTDPLSVLGREGGIRSHLMLSRSLHVL